MRNNTVEPDQIMSHDMETLAAEFASEPAVAIACMQILSLIAQKARVVDGSVGIATGLPLFLNGGPANRQDFLPGIIRKASARAASMIEDDTNHVRISELYLSIPPSLGSVVDDDDRDAFIVAKIHQDVRSSMSSLSENSILLIVISGMDKASSLVQEGVAEMFDLVKGQPGIFFSLTGSSGQDHANTHEAVRERFFLIDIPNGEAPSPLAKPKSNHKH